ncbi:restriction endonuclease subunit S [Paenirhodobacter sp.]|uniref:restriction endonuclease subunit S n=1 Tax=Paenirhodobacter sp. TaxID=1965326 RepID=UPI003B41EAD7
MKPYPAYKDSGVEWLGKVPEGWEVKRLRHIVRLQTEKATTTQNPIALENIEGWSGRIVETDTEFEGNGVAFDVGDILFGKLRPYLAKVAVAEAGGEAVGDFHVLRPSGDVLSRFLQLELLTPSVISTIDSSTYGSKMPRVSWEFMADLRFPLPPLPEQQAIAAFLDRETAKIDGLIEEQRRLIALLAEKRQTTISHAVTRGLNPDASLKPSGVEWLGDIPEGWEVQKLKYLGEAITGLTYSPDDVDDAGLLVLRSSNVQGGRICLEDNVYVASVVPERLLARQGDILICSRNGSRALIGKNAVIEGEAVNKTWGAFMTMFRGDMNDFLYFVMNSAIFQYQSASFLTSTINQLTIGNLNSMEVPVPAREEQREIIDYLQKVTAQLDTLTETAASAITLLQERRSALISAAVTGKIDVRGLAPAKAA